METNKTYTNKNPLVRIKNAFMYSMKGLTSAFKTEAAFRQDLIIFSLNTIAILFIDDKTFMAILFFAGLFLIFAELINTAIEYIVDLVTTDHKPLAGAAKDVGSALVFLSVINLAACWLIYWTF
jgi:diacylglycerol kinase (ATP)